MTKDIILFIDAIRPLTFEALDKYEKEKGRKFKPLVLVDEKIKHLIMVRNGQNSLEHDVDIITANFDSADSIVKAVEPYIERIFAVTAQYENSITELRKLVPHLQFLDMPTENSLMWATDKKLMREKLEAYDKSLVPRFTDVMTDTPESVAQIEKAVGYPLIIKPSGLEGSLLVSLVKDRKELIDTLKHTFKEMEQAYNKWIKRQVPAVVAEEFMEGDMYSIDTYLSSDGQSHHTPPVKVITGKQVGYEDFFGYARLSPSGLDSMQIKLAMNTAEAACKALGLKSVTAHVELMKTPKGWKVIELGPRIGGYRHEIYKLSYGINHIMNDILIRAGETPIIHSEIISSVAYFNLYSRNEGVINRVEGLDALKKLQSYISHRQILNVGDEALFARNNGDPVLEVTLSNKDSQQLMVDYLFVNDNIKIEVAPAT